MLLHEVNVPLSLHIQVDEVVEHLIREGRHWVTVRSAVFNRVIELLLMIFDKLLFLSLLCKTRVVYHVLTHQHARCRV